MREYKREKETLESQLRDVQRRSIDHDDHLRIIDAWWTQVCSIYALYARKRLQIELLDEVKLLVEDEVPSNDDIEGQFPPHLPNYRSHSQQPSLPH